MTKHTIEFEARGVKGNFELTEISNIMAYSQPTIHHVPKQLKKKVVSASVTPGTNLVEYKYSNGTTEIYNPDLDPMRFIYDWKLHNAAFIKDQYYDGLALSDFSYWSQQLRNYRASVTWGLANVVKLPYKEVKRVANMGVQHFKDDVRIFRGLDLDLEQTDDSKANDWAIAQKQASQAFYDSQSLH